MSEHADPPASNTAGELPPATAHSSPVISSLPPCTRPLLPCLPSIRTPYNPDIYNTYYHAPLPASSIPTITKLNGRNYRTWAINMELVLRRHQVWDLIHDILPLLVERSYVWKDQDLLAKSEIVWSCEPDVQALLSRCTSA